MLGRRIFTQKTVYTHTTHSVLGLGLVMSVMAVVPLIVIVIAVVVTCGCDGSCPNLRHGFLELFC